MEQSTSEFIICDRNVDMQLDSKLDTSSERSGQGKDLEAGGASSSDLETEELWESSANMMSLSSTLMTKNSSACLLLRRKLIF